MSEWKPSLLGRLLSRTPRWHLRLDDDQLRLIYDGRQFTLTLTAVQPLVFRPGWPWHLIDVPLRGGQTMALRGLPARHANRLANELKATVGRYLERQSRAAEAKRLLDRRQAFVGWMDLIRLWLNAIEQDQEIHDAERCWFTAETLAHHEEIRPTVPSTSDLKAMLQEPHIASALGERASIVSRDLELWSCDWHARIAKRNEQFTKEELITMAGLFDRVEKRPLNEEQSRAVICFNHRVQVVAAAGSGKTSTMVAKAAYAIERGFVAPEKILMLAFNTKAAEQLQERAGEALKRAGLPEAKIAAKTFHKFGLEILGQAEGQKRGVPDWVTDDEGVPHLSELIDELNDRDTEFRTAWDLFRIVFGKDIPKFGATDNSADWDTNKQKKGFRTLSGDLVKSQEERTIADWLFYNGVPFEYERDYEHPTADAEHRQYLPDFYYPTINLYHEHFAFDHMGNPPPSFEGYLESAIWKRRLHVTHGTALIETTSAQIWSGDVFKHLGNELTQRGIILDPNPDRPVPGRPVIAHEDLVRVFRTFIKHAKSNNLSLADLRKKLASRPFGTFGHRHRMFLDLYGRIRSLWDNELGKRGIDFEDMLGLAADALERGQWASPYDLVMVDEFQDASWARARLALALVNQPGRFLFAVGDDWQSINRFAGSDISVMTDFAAHAPGASVLRLRQTFRCPLALCEASSAFITKNPVQIRKDVISEEPQFGPVLEVFEGKHRKDIGEAVTAYLERLHDGLVSGDIPPEKNRLITVYVLGRYKADEKYVPSDWKTRFGKRLTVNFYTVHTSKGAEADYIILPGMTRNGFPCRKEDDPVLALAMPSGDDFHLAEERRLFYVAITRARRSVAMFGEAGKLSEFVTELIADGHASARNADGSHRPSDLCPTCGQSFIDRKDGPYGLYDRCASFPVCKFTKSVPKKPVNKKPMTWAKKVARRKPPRTISDGGTDAR